MVRRSKRWRGVRDDKEQLELVEFQPGTIYKHYYTLEDSDPGMMMETNIATKEVSPVVPKIDPIHTELRNNSLETTIFTLIVSICLLLIEIEHTDIGN